MLDIKKLLTKLAQPLTCTEVTLPYTPYCNGLLIGYIRTTSTGRAYETHSGATPGIFDGYSTAGSYIVGIEYVTKGTEVKSTGSGNVQSRKYWYIPIIGGGTQ